MLISTFPDSSYAGEPYMCGLNPQEDGMLPFDFVYCNSGLCLVHSPSAMANLSNHRLHVDLQASVIEVGEKYVSKL